MRKTLIFNRREEMMAAMPVKLWHNRYICVWARAIFELRTRWTEIKWSQTNIVSDTKMHRFNINLYAIWFAFECISKDPYLFSRFVRLKSIYICIANWIGSEMSRSCRKILRTEEKEFVDSVDWIMVFDLFECITANFSTFHIIAHKSSTFKSQSWFVQFN